MQKHQDKKEEIQKSVADFLPDVKVTSLETASDFLNYFRVLSSRKNSVMIQRDKRPYILAEELDFEKEEVSIQVRISSR